MKLVKKLLKWVGIVILSLLLISALSWGYQTYKTNQINKEIEMKLSNTSFSKNTVVEEIESYIRIIEDIHPNPYHTATKETIMAIKDDIIANLSEEVSHEAIFIAVSKLSSAYKDEHVYVDIPSVFIEKWKVGTNLFFPVKVQIVDNKLLAAETDDIFINGDEITKINGLESQKIIDSLGLLKSGRSLEQVSAYVSEDFSELFRIVFGMTDTFEVSFLRDNNTLTKTVGGVNYDLIESKKIQTNQYTITENGNVAYFQFDGFEELDSNKSLDQLIDEMFKDIESKGCETLVIDIRENRGGASAYGDHIFQYLSNAPFAQMTKSEIKVSDVTKSQLLTFIPSFIRWLPLQYIVPDIKPIFTQENGTFSSIEFKELEPFEASKRFDGKVILLTSEKTMSSASLFASTFKALEIGQIIGNPTGGYPIHYGNVWDVLLETTGLTVQIPSSINYGMGSESPVIPEEPLNSVYKRDLLSNDEMIDALAVEYTN